MSKSTLEIWGREFELNVIYECYPGEEVLDSQRAALEALIVPGVIDTSLDDVKAYVMSSSLNQVTSPIENIFKYVMPRSIFVPHSKKESHIAIMCNYKFDTEHGIAIVFENGVFAEIGPQDIVL